MKRMELVLIAFALLLLIVLNAGEAEADGFISPSWWEPVEIEMNESAPFYVSSPPPEKAYPEVEYHEVTVIIDENYAVTEVDQEFHNPYDYNMHGTYIFPVPAGAAISNFKLIIDGVSFQATLMDGEEASRLLDEAIRQNEDVSLLEFKERDLFTYEIFIPAHESRKVCLRYEELVPMRDGYYHYIYTLGTEQYSSALIDYVSLTITIKARNGIDEVFSPTHDIRIDRRGWKWDEMDSIYPYVPIDPYPREVEVTYQEEKARPDTDIELCISHRPGEFDGELYTNTTGDGGYFMFTFSPGGEVEDDRIIPKDVIFIMDQSGSMEGEKLDHTKMALKEMLGQLTENDRFTILNYNTHVGYYSENLLSVTGMEIMFAKRYVDHLASQGGTDIERVIMRALDIHKRFQRRDALKMIIFLTDGHPTAGVIEEDRIVDHIGRANHMVNGDARIFAFGVGYNVNTHLLDRITKENFGESTYITENDQIEPAITGFFEMISSPVLTGIRVEFEGFRTSGLFPAIIPDVYVGSQITICGRYVDPGGGGEEGRLITITVTGRTIDGERTFTLTFDLAETGEYEFIPRLWAIRKMGHLLDRMRLNGESSQMIEEIRDLGITHNIVTPYTSFLANPSVKEFLFDPVVVKPVFAHITLDPPDFFRDSGVDAITDSLFIKDLKKAGNTIDGGGIYGNDDPDFRINDYSISSFPDVNTEGQFFDIETGKEDFYVLPKTRVHQEPWNRTLDVDDADFYVRNLAIRTGDSYVSIIWDTTRSVESAIFYRQLGTPAWETYWSGRKSLEHTLKINELKRGWYEFSICLMDENGNLVIDDNSGNFYQFIVGQLRGSFIEQVTLMERDGITIEWRTFVPLMSTVYIRERGMEGFTSMDPIVFDPSLSRDHKLHLDLEAGDYEFFIASIDGDGQRFVDNNKGEYYSFSISTSAQEQGGTHLSHTTTYLLMLGVILFMWVMLLWSLWTRERQGLADISSMESLNRHISHFASDSAITSKLILLLLRKEAKPELIISRTFSLPQGIWDMRYLPGMWDHRPRSAH